MEFLKARAKGGVEDSAMTPNNQTIADANAYTTETNFQTPIWVCKVMASLVDTDVERILEPTPGKGNLARVLHENFSSAEIVCPSGDFFSMNAQDILVDCVVANPPFSPTALGYRMLERFFEFSGNVIVLMPWVVLINSEKRTNDLVKRGLSRIIHLPRRAFRGARVQTCILKFSEGYDRDIIFDIIGSD